MKRTFCDLCEAPCAEGKAMEFIHPSPVRDLPSAAVVVRVSFGYRGHPTGFSGPPDLCSACKKSLIKEVLDELSGPDDLHGE